MSPFGHKCIERCSARQVECLPFQLANLCRGRFGGTFELLDSARWIIPSLRLTPPIMRPISWHMALLGVCLAFSGVWAVPARAANAVPSRPLHPAVSASAQAKLPSSDCLLCHARGLGGAPKINANVLSHSVHASLSCVSCHAAVKRIPHSVAASMVPVNCARCHQFQGRELSQGSHARTATTMPGFTATQTSSSSAHSAPSCVTCHGTHGVVPVTSAAFRGDISHGCARCHAHAFRSYMSTPHGQAAMLGLASAPTCANCHNPHLALPPTNPLSRVSPEHRTATCRGCHTSSSPKFAGFDPHPQPGNPARSALVAGVHYFMVALLVGVFGFFGLHTLLWLQRSFVGRLRGELPPLKHFGGPHVLRFTVVDRLTHLTVILSFMLLALTGLALMHPGYGWARAITGFFGGVHTMHIVHVVNGGITFAYFFFHLCYMGYRVLVKKQRYRIFGVDSLVPTWTDIKDIWSNFRWFVYLGPQPKMDRWTYWEKFDYWAVFWGVAIIGVSGLMLAAPVFFTRFIPGIWLNVAFIVHSEEAILATGFIFIFHFFHNHLRPEKFPIDVSILTGRVPLDRFKEERPLQYQRLVNEGTLERLIVPPPSVWLTTISVIFGLAVIVTGLTLVALVIAAG